LGQNREAPGADSPQFGQNATPGLFAAPCALPSSVGGTYRCANHLSFPGESLTLVGIHLKSEKCGARFEAAHEKGHPDGALAVLLDCKIRPCVGVEYGRLTDSQFRATRSSASATTLSNPRPQTMRFRTCRASSAAGTVPSCWPSLPTYPKRSGVPVRIAARSTGRTRRTLQRRLL
jgi:hypothetical protein